MDEDPAVLSFKLSVQHFIDHYQEETRLLKVENHNLKNALGTLEKNIWLENEDRRKIARQIIQRISAGRSKRNEISDSFFENSRESYTSSFPYTQNGNDDSRNIDSMLFHFALEEMEDQWKSRYEALEHKFNKLREHYLKRRKQWAEWKHHNKMRPTVSPQTEESETHPRKEGKRSSEIVTLHNSDSENEALEIMNPPIMDNFSVLPITISPSGSNHRATHPSGDRENEHGIAQAIHSRSAVRAVTPEPKPNFYSPPLTTKRPSPAPTESSNTHSVKRRIINNSIVVSTEIRVGEHEDGRERVATMDATQATEFVAGMCDMRDTAKLESSERGLESVRVSRAKNAEPLSPLSGKRRGTSAVALGEDSPSLRREFKRSTMVIASTPRAHSPSDLTKDKDVKRELLVTFSQQLEELEKQPPSQIPCADETIRDDDDQYNEVSSQTTAGMTRRESMQEVLLELEEVDEGGVEKRMEDEEESRSIFSNDQASISERPKGRYQALPPSSPRFVDSAYLRPNEEEDGATSANEGENEGESVDCIEETILYDREEGCNELVRLDDENEVEAFVLDNGENRIRHSEKKCSNRGVGHTPRQAHKRNDEPQYKYNETVRKKDKRRQLRGTDCGCCRRFYEVTAGVSVLNSDDNNDASPTFSHSNQRQPSPGTMMERRLQRVSRHRYKHKPPASPPGYWNVDFPTTDELEEWREEANRRREEQETGEERNKVERGRMERRISGRGRGK
ncbi:uncharacterized protein VTP21DRAFT_2405 [Calcarisporiella thermophila]|uniref:uncharacterized protein n=1 Tax=Calcarisporiella thermophila TaxID=911321 RepID=UPI003744208A